MDKLQELLQRTETIQKINALQEHAAVEIFSWPAYSGKDRLKREVSAQTGRASCGPIFLAQRPAGRRAFSGAEGNPGQQEF